tara:strand:- start:3167 stop:3676 length:510 start_codon:yes stop_codon:yes gene_type:complete
MPNIYGPQTTGEMTGNVAGTNNWNNYLRDRWSMDPSLFHQGDAKAKQEITAAYGGYLDDLIKEQQLNQDPNSFMKDAAGLLRGINQDNIDADSKRFEDALKYSREGAKTKMMMKLPGQIADIARMPGAIQLQAAQEQAKRTQDFIRSIALMDNIKVADPGAIPNRKYFG